MKKFVTSELQVRSEVGSVLERGQVFQQLEQKLFNVHEMVYLIEHGS
jgi:hypothetical protein